MGKEKKLSDRMKGEAVNLGLCARWTQEWEDDTTKDAMVEKFVNGIDFCIKHDWPSVEVMKKDFGDVIHNHGVYADEAVRLTNPYTVILNGRCDASMTCDMFAVTNIYVRHSSKLNIVVKDRASVHISVYDNAEVDIKTYGDARCFVFKYGGKVTTGGSGKITVRERETDN